ncbi:xanthine/uracil/thiamine/ascorbate permease family protein [Klebsiella quasipneumoniae]|nr:xanthine/uracil/thiamine/ascorbate permease family protein [Klebsiella quasipneumoniae]
MGGEAGLLDEEGNMPQINRPFMVDSIAAALGPWVGIPAATALIESSAAAEAGGKTGLTALSAAVMFLLMLLFTPVALMIPKEATAPALILIGLNMFSGLRKVDLGNFTDGLPVLMMVMITLIANSFGTGIAGGLLFYIVIKAIAGKWRGNPDWPVGAGRPSGLLLRDLSQTLSPSQCAFTSSYNKRTAAESCLRCGQIRFNGTTSPW